jgi:hypothetical protein
MVLPITEPNRIFFNFHAASMTEQVGQMLSMPKNKIR